MRRKLALATWVVALALIVVVTRQLRVRAMTQYLETQRYEDVYYLPPAAWLPTLSLGYDEALADLLWMRALIYFGQELEHRGAVKHALDYADAILELDPQFREVYRWAGTVGMYKPQGHTAEDVRRSIEYMERAVRIFPDDGELAWDLGAAYSFELAPIVEDPDEKDRYRQRGVEHMQTAARLGSGPPWLALTNATQLERLGQTEQAIRHLEEMYAYVEDPATREQIRMRLEAARSAAYGEAFQRFHQELELRRQEEFPYVERELYPFIGPRPPTNPSPWLERRFMPEAVLEGEGAID